MAALIAKEPPLSSATDTIQGLANEAVGNVKQGIGNATDNDKLKGEAQKTTGDVKDGAKQVADKVTGKA